MNVHRHSGVERRDGVRNSFDVALNGALRMVEEAKAREEAERRRRKAMKVCHNLSKEVKAGRHIL